MFNKLGEQFRASEVYKSYATRDKNERMIIAGLVLLIAVTLIWLMIWQPVNTWSIASQERHQRTDSLLQWMQANEQQARSTSSGPTSGTSNEGVLRVATRTLKQSGLDLTRIQPENSGGVSVVLQKQPFNDVMRWLDLVQNREGINVIQASIDADADSGRVNARFSLRR